MSKKYLSLVLFVGVSCQSPPSASLRTDVALHRDVTTRRLIVGDLLLNSPPYVIPAKWPTTEIRGHWGLQPSKWPLEHHFQLTVERRRCSDIADYLGAMSGANGEYRSFGSLSAISIYGRFARREFPWGTAVTFVSQGSQDGPYSPDNGHMSYEIWGCDPTHRRFVRFRCSITHPSWPEWADEQIRSFKHWTQSEIDADPDVKALESLPPDSFCPSLTQIDKFVESIKLR
jgi:hypothetical protein